MPRAAVKHISGDDQSSKDLRMLHLNQICILVAVFRWRKWSGCRVEVTGTFLGL
jgi:hypothetical protein